MLDMPPRRGEPSGKGRRLVNKAPTKPPQLAADRAPAIPACVVPHGEPPRFVPRQAVFRRKLDGTFPRMPRPQYSPGRGRGNLLVVATLEFFWTFVQWFEGYRRRPVFRV